MDFVTYLLITTNWTGGTYNSILIIVNRLTKIVHYERVKVTINALDLAEIIIKVVIQY